MCFGDRGCVASDPERDVVADCDFACRDDQRVLALVDGGKRRVAVEGAGISKSDLTYLATIDGCVQIAACDDGARGPTSYGEARRPEPLCHYADTGTGRAFADGERSRCGDVWRQIVQSAFLLDGNPAPSQSNKACSGNNFSKRFHINTLAQPQRHRCFRLRGPDYRWPQDDPMHQWHRG